jgi:hypothetical protein
VIIVREGGEDKAHAHYGELRHTSHLGFLHELGGFVLQPVHLGESVLLGFFQKLLSFFQLFFAFPILFLHLTAPKNIGQRLCSRQLEVNEISVSLEERQCSACN